MITRGALCLMLVERWRGLSVNGLDVGTYYLCVHDTDTRVVLLLPGGIFILIVDSIHELKKLDDEYQKHLSYGGHYCHG